MGNFAENLNLGKRVLLPLLECCIAENKGGYCYHYNSSPHVTFPIDTLPDRRQYSQLI